MFKGVDYIGIIFKRVIDSFYTCCIHDIRCFFLNINYFSDTQKYNYAMILTGVVLLCTIGAYILRKCSSYLEKLNEKKCFFVLVIICLVVKLTWVLMYRIEPLVDYATFYYTAEALREEFVINNRYIVLFPNIFGYASFLSIFLKIFGASHMVAPIVNVVLTTISMGLIYVISRKICGVKTAITASILWIVLPSQTIYNMFAISEPQYCY